MSPEPTPSAPATTRTLMPDLAPEPPNLTGLLIPAPDPADENPLFLWRDDTLAPPDRPGAWWVVPNSDEDPMTWDLVLAGVAEDREVAEAFDRAVRVRPEPEPKTREQMEVWIRARIGPDGMAFVAASAARDKARRAVVDAATAFRVAFPGTIPAGWTVTVTEPSALNVLADAVDALLVAEAAADQLSRADKIHDDPATPQREPAAGDPCVE
jgi:hypothetical protein